MDKLTGKAAFKHVSVEKGCISVENLVDKYHRKAKNLWNKGPAMVDKPGIFVNKLTLTVE